MKKSILVIKCLMVAIVLSMVSCSADDGVKCPDSLVGELTAAETELTGSWVLVAMEGNEALDITDDKISNPSTDIFAQFTYCQRDLVYAFNDNRNYSQKQGFIAPVCKEKNSITGTWRLAKNNRNEGVLSFVANCATLDLEIEMNDLGDAFTYKSNVGFQDANGVFKTVFVKFTYDKVRVSA